MPDIRPFRALRYDPETVGDPGEVVAPPYDVIGADLHRELLARHPHNAVRLDLPAGEPGEDPDERYRRAARTLTAWRSDGTLRKDPRPSVYVYQQTYRVPGHEVERTQRGFFARLRLEPFGSGSWGAPARTDAVGPEGGPLPPVAGHGHQHLARSSASMRTPRERRLRRWPAITAEGQPSRTSRTMTACATGCGSWRTRARDPRRACSLRPPRPAPSSSPTVITGTRPRCATGMSAERPGREQDPAFDSCSCCSSTPRTS